jgi:hypothetical protein
LRKEFGNSKPPFFRQQGLAPLHRLCNGHAARTSRFAISDKTLLRIESAPLSTMNPYLRAVREKGAYCACFPWEYRTSHGPLRKQLADLPHAAHHQEPLPAISVRLGAN